MSLHMNGCEWLGEDEYSARGGDDGGGNHLSGRVKQGNESHW